MQITLITPTADQPNGVVLLEKYMSTQTEKFHQWIVADDGIEHASLTMGQTHLVRPRQHEGAQSLASNILAALPHVSGDIVIIVEHDDYYAKDHISVCLDRLEHVKATGSKWQRYYNVYYRTHRTMKNIGSALCNTAFRAELIPHVERAAQKAFSRNAIGLDRFFWDSLAGMAVETHDINTVVGIKGLPGRKGLGIGHKPPDGRSTPDPDLNQLRAWIGDDAESYAQYGRV
ncbi:MAG: glycosyltransferase family A protein [Pseudomonadota bacterium]